VIESLLLSVTRVSTLLGQQQLTSATGFFFERDSKLFLITSRHVMLDEANDHRPDRLTIELHIDPADVAATTQWIIPLYRDNQPSWREGLDSNRRCRRPRTRSLGSAVHSPASGLYSRTSGGVARTN
jgi:hypothetical protein